MRHTPLARRTGLQRTGGLNQVSRKRQDETPELRRWHDAVLERDKGECQLPLRYDGTTPIERCWGKIEAHHVNGRAGKLLTDVDNGVALCQVHHRYVHGWGYRMGRKWGLI